MELPISITGTSRLGLSCFYPALCLLSSRFAYTNSLLTVMRFIDILNFGLSFLGIYGLMLNFRYLLPYYVIPVLSARLAETRQLLDNAEASSAISSKSEIRMHFTLCDGVCIVYIHHLIQSCRSANQFATMRMESNQAQGIFQQLQAAIRSGLTYRLYSLSGRIGAIKLSLEVRCTAYLTYLAYLIIMNVASAGD